MVLGSVALMVSTRQELGRWGESLAADFLAQKGYTIIALNRRTSHGEIDLIAKQRDTLIFVEVKTRSTDVYGLPEASVTASKRSHLIASAQAYLQEHPDPNVEWRIDVVVIRKLKSSNQPEIIHFENAIT